RPPELVVGDESAGGGIKARHGVPPFSPFRPTDDDGACTLFTLHDERSKSGSTPGGPTPWNFPTAPPPRRRPRRRPRCRRPRPAGLPRLVVGRGGTGGNARVTRWRGGRRMTTLSPTGFHCRAAVRPLEDRRPRERARALASERTARRRPRATTKRRRVQEHAR